MKKSTTFLLISILMGCGQTGPLQLPHSEPQVAEGVTEASDKSKQRKITSHNLHN